MRIVLATRYDNGQAYGDRTGQVFGTTYEVINYVFDTDSLTVTQESAGTYDDFQDVNDPIPYQVTGEFHSVCVGSTRQPYIGDGQGGFYLGPPEANSPWCGMTAPVTCTLTIDVLDTSAPQFLNGDGTITYVVNGAAGPGDLQLLVYALPFELLVFDQAPSGNGTFVARTPLLQPGDYRLQLTQAMDSGPACVATATATIGEVPVVIVEPPVVVTPPDETLPVVEPPFISVPIILPTKQQVALAEGDGYLLVQLQQTLQPSFALGEPDEVVNVAATSPEGLSFKPNPDDTLGFAQQGAVTGVCDSRLSEVAGFNALTPYVVGEFGVTYVDAQQVSYSLDGVQYTTDLATEFTSYAIGYVDPVTDGLLSTHALVAREDIMYHERRPIQNYLDIQRNDQPVLLDFYAVARATTLEELPKAT
jgi:hypothetical protein